MDVPATDVETQRRCDAAGAPASDGTVQRYDRGELRPLYERADGSMLFEGFVAKPGVMVYVGPNGKVTRELIPAEELHKADSLATLGRAPVTLEHPPEDVTPDNYAAYSAGDLDGEVAIVEGGYVKVRGAIRRRDAIEAVKAGKVEASPGYRCRIDATPGVHPDFGAYDAIQRDRVYNHKAIVDLARGGHDIRMRADSAYQQASGASGVASAPSNGGPMDPVILAALKARGVPEATVTACATRTDGSAGLKAAFDAILEQYDGLVRQKDKMQAQLDAFDLEKKMAAEAKAKADEHAAMEAEKAKAQEKPADEELPAPKLDALLAFHRERADLEAHASALKLDAAEVAKLDNAGLKRAVVKAANPAARADASDAYIDAAFDLLSKQDAGNAWASVTVPAKREDAKPPTPPTPINAASVNSYRGAFEANRPQGA